MKRVKLALNLRGLDPSGTEVYGNSIYMSMNGNVNYPNAVNYVSQLNSGVTDLHSAITAAVPSKINIKSKLVHVEKILHAIAAHVELECGDDEVKALSSGFSLKQASLSGPKVFNAEQGMLSGSVKLESPFADTRAAYVWEMIADPINTNVWQQFKITNTTSTGVAGLTPGNKYWFRVKAIVSDMEQLYSDPHMVHVV